MFVDEIHHHYHLVHSPIRRRFWRVAYFDFRRRGYVCLPIGIHLIVRWGRRLLEWTYLYHYSHLERLLFNEYTRGWEDGHAGRSVDGIRPKDWLGREVED